MARNKPKILKSKFTDHIEVEFPIIDFEFEKGEATLVNLNCNKTGLGQLISISGTICDDSLSQCNGPRALFKSDNRDIERVLDEYLLLASC